MEKTLYVGREKKKETENGRCGNGRARQAFCGPGFDASWLGSDEKKGPVLLFSRPRERRAVYETHMPRAQDDSDFL